VRRALDQILRLLNEGATICAATPGSATVDDFEENVIGIAVNSAKFVGVKPSDGGPAFPRQHTVADANEPSFKQGTPGMSLRDYFAAAALTGLYSVPLLGGATFENAEKTKAYFAAKIAYEIADAMLAAREHNPPPSVSSVSSV
jgi:hypothetical protein